MDIRIREYIDTDFDSLNELLQEVYSVKKKQNSNVNKELVAVYNNEVVGYLTINKQFDSVKNIKYCYINYVCVKEEYRRYHIATELLIRVEELCREENISYIELTSNQERFAAQELYKKNGYEKRDTNVYRRVILW